MRKFRKAVSIILSVSMLVSGLYVGVGKSERMNAATKGIENSDFLKANGKVLKNNYGNGDVVYLRGTNAGGYALQEFWMCPTDNSPNVSAQYDIWTVLTNRFGEQAARTLINTYEENYWRESDFDECAKLGMNCIRLPLWYRNFVDSNGNWYSDAFDRVDWFVEQAGKRGMYVVIDMHGAYGSQNGSDHSGVDGGDNKIGASQFFFGSNAASNQEKYYQMWERLADHFKGNPAVAGYDLLNEPYCTYRYNSGYSDDYLHSMLWNVYDNAYKRIRAIDRDHVIIMEATWDSWDLPNPDSYGWQNVMYEYHNYEYNDYDNAEGKQISSMQNKINNIFSGNYNVPSYMGEFAFFNNLDAWRQGLQLLNSNGLNWTSWTYKCVAEYGNWGIMNQVVDRVNVEYDSYDTILNKWSKVGNSYENTGLANVIKEYTPGTVAATEYASIANGKYYLTCNDKVVCADNSGDDPLIANRDSYGGSWETFHIINNADGTISIKSDINNKYVCAVIDENSQLLARSDQINDWEKFKLVHIQGNQYGIKAMANGRYVKADFGDEAHNGQLKAASDSVAGAWEAFYFNLLEQDETQPPATTQPETQAPTIAQPETKVPTGFTEAGIHDWIVSGNWGCYFGDWSGVANGGYKLDGDTYSVYVSETNLGVEWLIQARYDVAVTEGHTYKVTVNVSSDKAGSIGIKEDLSNGSEDPVYTDINAGGSVNLTGTYKVNKDTMRIMFALGKGISAGTTLTFNSVTVEDVTPAETTKTPEAETSAAVETTAKTSGEEPTNQGGGEIGDIDWDSIDYAADGAGGGAYNGKYKFYSVDGNGALVNIQLPGFAEEAGLYVTFPKDVTGTSLSKSYIQGGGIILPLSVFTAKITRFTVTDLNGVHECVVYYEDGIDGEDIDKTTAAGENTTTKTEIPKKPEGLTYAGNDEQPYYFAWAGAVNVTYNFYIDGVKVAEGITGNAYNAVAQAAMFTVGTHTIGITAVNSAGESEMMTIEYVVKEQIETTEEESSTEETTTSEETTTETETTTERQEASIEINGYQISTEYEGHRVIYSVNDPNSETQKVGLIYGLADYCGTDEMTINSENNVVYTFEATEAGKLSHNYSDITSAQSYAMTMKFIKTAEYYNARIYVRAYAVLDDGSIVYSDVSCNSVYDIAEELYRDRRMSTEARHKYLYDNIIKVCKPEYGEIEYLWESSLAKN